MGQGFVNNGIATNVQAVYQDSANLDAFSRLRVSTPTYVFDGQLTYDLQPLLYEPVANNGGGGTASVTFDSANRCALMTFAAALTGASAYMQTYEYFRYQPGRSQMVFVTFNFIETKADVLKFAGYCDGTNGVQLEQDGSTVQLKLYSATTLGSQTVAKAAWNIDPMDGTGPSGKTLDLTKTQILVIDFQALYVGRIRIGFDIGGVLYYVHQFTCANVYAYPYAQTMNLPVRCGMTSSGTVSTTMNFICSSVSSESGDDASGYNFAQGSGAVTAGNNTRVHALSVRPRQTFLGIANRVRFVPESIEAVITTGTVAVLWELCLGQATTGGSWINVNPSYSCMEYMLPTGLATGSPGIVIANGYLSGSAQAKSNVAKNVAVRYPITLNQAGATRLNGTLTLLVTGISNTSPCQISLNWREVR